MTLTPQNLSKNRTEVHVSLMCFLNLSKRFKLISIKRFQSIESAMLKRGNTPEIVRRGRSNKLRLWTEKWVGFLSNRFFNGLAHTIWSRQCLGHQNTATMKGGTGYHWPGRGFWLIDPDRTCYWFCRSRQSICMVKSNQANRLEPSAYSCLLGTLEALLWWVLLNV